MLRHVAEVAISYEPNPILELTKLTSVEAERQIRAHVFDVNMVHMKYIVIITGVIINTDYSYSDYVSINHFMVYDVTQGKFVEEVKNPLQVIR